MPVKRVRTKPLSAEAVEFDGTNHDEVAEFTGSEHVRRGPSGETEARGGSGSWHQLHPGDHVIKHENGDHHVVSAKAKANHWEDE